MTGKLHTLLIKPPYGPWIRSALILGLALWFMPGCVNRMFYYPDTFSYRDTASFPYTVNDIYFESLDGTMLHGWHLLSPATNPAGTIVHFHGNAQNISAHVDFVDWLPLEGFHIFTFDYRGYGKSKGRPSREGLYMDGVAAVQKARDLAGEVGSNRIFAIGQSIGGATALAVAGRHPELGIKAMLIDSAFHSYRGIVRDKIREMPLLSLLARPLSFWLMQDDYSPHLTLTDINAPLLFIHASDDFIIPASHSRMLYDAANEPKEIIILNEASHINGLIAHRSEIGPRMIELFNGQP